VRKSRLSAKLSKYAGEVSERFKEHAWKACVGEILPWVQIPPSPPNYDTLEEAEAAQAGTVDVLAAQLNGA
jgi:hypothetical protein